jgi:hypothetical protein
VARVEFYPDNDPRLGGASSVEHSVSYTESVRSGLIRYSTSLMRDARNTLALTNHREDVVPAKIDVLHQDETDVDFNPIPHWLDSVVYMHLDETVEVSSGGSANDYAAVMSIEMGHWSMSGRPWGEGPRRKKLKPSERKRWVKGVAPLQKAAKKAYASRRLTI